MKNIVFLVICPLTKRDYKRFGIDTLKKNFKVYVFDMTELYRPEYSINNNEKVQYFDGYYSINNLKQYYNKIDELNIYAAIDFLDISTLSFKIRNKLKKNKIFLTKTQSGLQPKIPNLQKRSKLISHIFSISKWKKLFFTIHKLFFPEIYFSSDSILSGGLSGEKLIAAKFSKIIIPAHSYDYETYLSLKKNQNINQKPYAVFIDQYIAHHPDIDYLGLDNPINPKTYFNLLESFFLNFESKFNIEVKIAAHPRSDYELHPKIFKNRKIYKGKTAELIRDSKYVFLHNSNSVSFAVLWEKPLIFITSDQINKLVPSLKFFAEFFYLNPLDLNSYSENELKKCLNTKIDKSVYKNYRNQFLKHPLSINKPFWDIYSDFLLNRINK